MKPPKQIAGPRDPFITEERPREGIGSAKRFRV